MKRKPWQQFRTLAALRVHAPCCPDSRCASRTCARFSESVCAGDDMCTSMTDWIQESKEKNRCISFRHVSKVFWDCPVPVAALKNIDLDIGYGEFVSVTGTSGSGKTTLLNLAAGLDTPTGGDILIDAQCINHLHQDQLTVFRRRQIGMIYQNFNLLDILNIKENITFPLELDGTLADWAYILKLCRMLGIEQKLNALPAQLSGGEKQKAAIARALAGKPAILLADEPTGNLDGKSGLDVLGLLKSINQELGQTIVMVTHNLEAAQFADRIVRIGDGRIL